MYPVSEAFLQAVQENTRRYYWTGRITTKKSGVFEFGADDIVKGSGYISSQCCGNTEIEIGTVYSSEMGITLLSDIDRYTLQDALVELFYHLRLADGSYETVPMGLFEVSEANRTAKCLEIKAYDYMLRFEEDFNGFETIGNACDFIELCCKVCKVEMAQSREEIEAMPNGSEMLSIYTDNDIETYRDVLYYVGQVLGGVFCINREGKLELRKFGNEPVMEVWSKHRFTSSFSDFITRYTAVSSTNMKTEIAEYYHLDPDDGLTLNLGVNPLLQFGLKETREQLCMNILYDLSVVDYVPFDSDTIGNPALDLGDVIKFRGGQADGTKISAITSMQCKIGGKHTLKSVGKNPRLAQAKSKNDKNISGLLNQIIDNKGCTDYKKAVQTIKDGGYATSLTYVEKLCSIIEKWKLTNYDVKDSGGEAVRWYRVRKSWADSKSQKGAYKVLANAKKCVDQNPGYKVFDADGKMVYEPKAAEPAVKVPFLVRVKISDLNIRKGPGTNYDRVQFCPLGVYTMVATSSGAGASLWGKLKSGIGWLSLDYVQRV